jgi:hypothetical protein
MRRVGFQQNLGWKSVMDPSSCSSQQNLCDGHWQPQGQTNRNQPLWVGWKTLFIPIMMTRVSDFSNYSTRSNGDLIGLCKKWQLDKSSTKKEGSSPKPTAKEFMRTPVRIDAKRSDRSLLFFTGSSSSEGETGWGTSASSFEESQGKSSPVHWQVTRHLSSGIEF